MAVTKSLKQKLIRTTMTILAIVGLPAAGMMMYMQQRTNDANLAMTEKNISDSLNDKGATIIKNQALALKGFVEELSMTSVLNLCRGQLSMMIQSFMACLWTRAICPGPLRMQATLMVKWMRPLIGKQHYG